jgi:membrane associated rhomboid family serine protease
MPESEAMNPTEYSRDRSPRQARPGGSTTRLRALFFALAALWGFVAGIGALVAGFQLNGQPVRVGPWLIGTAIPGALFAIVGGIVAANAYREARDRRRK